MLMCACVHVYARVFRALNYHWSRNYNDSRFGGEVKWTKTQTFTIPHFSFLGTFLVFDSLIFLSSVRVWCVGNRSLCLQYQLQPVQTLQRVTMRRLNPMRKLSMVRTVFKVRCIIYRTAPGDEFIPYSSSELASALAVYYCKEYQYYF